MSNAVAKYHYLVTSKTKSIYKLICAWSNLQFNKRLSVIIACKYAMKLFGDKDIVSGVADLNDEDINSLSEVKNFLCLLNPENFSDIDEYYQALRNTNYDLLLIEVSYNNVFFTKEQIEELKIKDNGGKRIVIAYLSIGEAEDYRYYWKKKWNKKKPKWIIKENENWEGNYIVKYWSPEWKNIIKEYQKKLDEIGVDGYLLDTVDTYQYFEENYKKTLE